MALKSNGGEFKVTPYSEHDGDPGNDTSKTCGVDVDITFTPAETVRSNKISFVQVMKCTKGDGKPLLFDNEKPRATGKDEAGGGDADEGYCVDRLAGRKSANYGENNDGTAASTTIFGSRTDKTTHTDAWMHDAVRLPRASGKTFSCDATAFALDNTNGKYLGGVKWGYDVDAKGKVTKRAASIGSMGDPAGVHAKALEKWNEQAQNKDTSKRNHADQKKVPVPPKKEQLGDFPLPAGDTRFA